jgi:uncharacterized protein YcbX
VPLTLAAINRFPVKSCRGEALAEATVEPWGLAGDRRWVVVDENGVTLTAREHRPLLLVRPTLREDGGLDLTGPDLPDLSVDVPIADSLIPIRIHSSELLAAGASAEAGAWFSKLLGVSAQLIYLDDPTRRRPNPRFANPDDSVAGADAYPLHVTTEASLAALNDWIAEGPLADEGPVPMIRFRPNVVVAGGAAWKEDGWRRVRVGAALFRAVKGCDRCVMTLTDPDTTARSKEPIATLARYRRWDGETWFGMDLVPDNPGAQIRVGDEVEVLDSLPAPDGPPR